MSFLVNVTPYEEKNTRRDLTILRNVFYGNISYGEICDVKYKDMSEREIYKLVFGKQLMCKQYRNKNWIWTFCTPDKKVVVYFLSSVRGTSFEFPFGTDVSRLNSLLKEIEREILNYPDEKI